MSVPFTQVALQKLLGTTGQRLAVKDSQVKGLRAELREGGSISFQVVARVPGGRVVRYQIGKFPAVTVEAARKHAKRTLGELATGNDVAAVRREEREELTFDACFQQVWLPHARQHKKTWEEDERQFKKLLKAWHNRKLSTITRTEVKALHLRIGKENGNYAANRLLALLHAIFAKAITEELTQANPAHGVKKFKERSRDRFLLPDEIPRFFTAVKAEPDPMLRDFFLMLVYTGARRSNLAAMRWDEINLDSGIWRIPDTKSGESVTLPLVAEAISLLELRQQTAKDSPFVFASYGRSGHITEPKFAWKRVLTNAGIDNLRLHDLRRTLGSWQAASGASLTVIGKSLGHKNTATTAVYARLNIDPVRESVNSAVNAMLKTVEKGRENA